MIDSVIQFLSAATAAQQIRFGDAADNGAGYIQYNHADNNLSLEQLHPERLKITKAGKCSVLDLQFHKQHLMLYVGVTGKSSITYGGGTDDTKFDMYSNSGGTLIITIR